MEEENRLEEKKPDNVGVIVVVFICILVIAIITFILINPIFNKITFNYNGYLIHKNTENGLQYDIFLKLDGREVSLSIRIDPREVDSIPIDKAFREIILNSSQIYTAIDPYANMTAITSLAALEIDKIIDNQYLYAIPVNSAFTREMGNYTVKTCEDSKDRTSVILLELANKTEVIVKNKCIIINGETEEDLIRAADRLVLTLLGIIKN